MHIRKAIIFAIAFVFALTLYSPALALVATACQIDCDKCSSTGNGAPTLTSSMLTITAASFSVESDMCCPAGSNEAKHPDDSHCHDLHCHIQSCCISMSIATACSFNSPVDNDRDNIVCSEKFNAKDLIYSIFKPPQ